MATLKDQIAQWNFGGSLKRVEPAAATAKPASATAASSAAPVTAAPVPASVPSGATASPAPPSSETAGEGPRAMSATYYTTKRNLHQKLLARVDLSSIENLSSEQLRTQLSALLKEMIEEEALPVNEEERASLVTDLQNEVVGFGPLEPLLSDPAISEIMVNGPDAVFVEKKGRIQRVQTRFNDDAHLRKVIDKIVSRVGRRIDESSPMADARLPDGSRVNAIIPPLALDGSTLTIRRFATVPLQMSDLLSKNALTPEMAQLLAGLVQAKSNVVISGGTGSGKTTLLNILSSYIPTNERIITIEDTAELQLQQEHVVRLETRPPNIEGKGEVSIRALVKNSLRMRPDRIVLGEIRGGEVIDMLQAMNTGHDGSLTTVHANTPRDALGRLENLVGLGGMNLPMKALRQMISSAVHVIVQATRLSDGSRKVTSIAELSGMEGDVITLQEIFLYERTGTNPDGSVAGHFRATGVRPMLAEKLKSYGIDLPEDLFDPNRRLG